MATEPPQQITELNENDIARLLDQHAEEPVRLYVQSLIQQEDHQVMLASIVSEKKLIVVGTTALEFQAEETIETPAGQISICNCSSVNADALRNLFEWTAPTSIGYTSAIGCGDRLGLASPGHIRACRERDVTPVLAQQSIREMERTGRSAQEVMDDVTWAVFQEGYDEGFGADADHLKSPNHIDTCFEAGYTMYTIDPSDHVDNEADELDATALDDRFEQLPWKDLQASPADLISRYTGDTAHLTHDDQTIGISLDEQDLKCAAVKYGAAIAHTKMMARYLAKRYQEDKPGETFDLEMSVDETDHPTRPHEHYFVASELQRLGVEVTSLAPRFAGQFQKGIDFIGDVDQFEASFRKHAIIAGFFGGYKLSIHSGSDKFTAFPIIGQHAGKNVHLKTAGTSFLEALRIPARYDPEFFREIVEFAFERFQTDRKTYHVTTDLEAIPSPGDVESKELESIYLDEQDGRQLLHITYGSILSAQQDGKPRFKKTFFKLLHQHEEEHYATLKDHFVRHIDSVGQMTTRTDLKQPSQPS